MNPTEIYDALDAIAKAPYSAKEFGFSFAEATDNAKATVSKLKTGTTNKSDVPGGVLLNKKFHYAPAPGGKVDAALETLRASRKTAAHQPAILIATDGETVSAEHPKSGDRLHCAFHEIGDHFGFFLPAAGKDRYKPAEENPIDVKAAGKLAKLYDALVRLNPDWGTAAKKHAMNQFMTRLVFCLFAEDVGIFPDKQFARLIFTHAGSNGEEARKTIVQAFTAMNRKTDDRADLPAWTRELEYVNGGLFAGEIDAPEFDRTSFRYLRDACDLTWADINPDIFGSMIQSVADPELRTELGMHYTSVPNIMKVLGPLLLDDLDQAIEKAWDRPPALRRVLDRMAAIRVFDPACGSGNFLVVAYRELRAREIRILSRLGQIEGQAQVLMWSNIPLANFYGIEIADFAAETAKLAMFIAEHQANRRFKDAFGQAPASLPLRASAGIVTGNSLRLNWEAVCPPSNDFETFIAGNPPFLGDGSRSDEQNADMDHVLSGHVDSYRRVDFVACWIFKAANYIRGRRAASALVSTNSICQGQPVAAFWPSILRQGVEISFAHHTFKWRNNAAENAAVMCVVVGLRNETNTPKRLFDADVESTASNINAYLLNGPNLFVAATPRSLFGLPYMEYGNKPTDGGHLILAPEEKASLLERHPEAERFVKRYKGSQEVIRGIERYCLWVTDKDAEEAARIPALKARFDAVAKFRASSSAAQTRPSAAYPHRFRQAQNTAKDHAILIPRHSSETREYLPIDRVGADTICSDANMVIYDAPEWYFSILASRLHLVWIAAVCGRIKSDFRYSNTMGWNTFAVPAFSEGQIDALSHSTRAILRARYLHHPKTIADLYDPDEMPDDLRAAHQANDELLERMYVGRPFRNDTERLEHLFKLYAARIQTLGREAA